MCIEQFYIGDILKYNCYIDDFFPCNISVYTLALLNKHCSCNINIS